MFTHIEKEVSLLLYSYDGCSAGQYLAIPGMTGVQQPRYTIIQFEVTDA
ncbi:hypothetical protein HGH93_09325 [Chitinophaga polysaccharea]|nr:MULTISPECIES: hypothetical protein [Chitinophaga]NLR58298.1 hypothetical protein [Chitinophaga polysaccharea]NLU90824.1 hypothetical protein [Chitinophaga sp. Ak27]